MDSALPDLDTSSSSASSPNAHLETPFTFDRGFKLGTSPNSAVLNGIHGGLAVEDTSTCQQTGIAISRIPSGGSLALAAEAMPSLGSPVATHPLRDRRGSGDATTPDEKFGVVRTEGRTTTLAPRPSLVASSLHTSDPDIFVPRLSYAPLNLGHYPGIPATVHLQQPTVTPFAPSFRFGAPSASEQVYNSDEAFLGTPTTELGPFEYPINVGDSTEPDVMSATLTSPACLNNDGLLHISNGTFVLNDINDSLSSPLSPSRSITTGQIPMLPTARRPSVVHSATVAEVPQSEVTGTNGPDTVALGRKLSNSRRRPSLLLARFQPAATAPIPPSLLNGRRGSLPVSSLFPTAGNGFPSMPSTAGMLARPVPTQSWTPGAGSNPNAVGTPTISAAYLYNRRASLATLGPMSSPLLGPTSAARSNISPVAAPSSPAPSSRGSFSSHSTVTETTRDQGMFNDTLSDSRRISLPLQTDQPPPFAAALEALRKTKANAEATEQAMVGQARPRKNSQNSHLNPSNRGGRSSTSAISSSSDSSGNDQDDSIEHPSLVSRAAAAIRERRRSSRNSALSRGSLPILLAEDILASHKGDDQSQGSSNGEEDIPVADSLVEVELADSFAEFSFPPLMSSPFKRNSMTRPTLETIASDDVTVTESQNSDNDRQ